MSVLFLFVVLIITGLSESARILAVFPSPSISHQIVFRPLTQELAKRGHQLVIITTDPEFTKEAHPNIQEIDVHDISYKMWREEILSIAATDINDVKTQMDMILQMTMKIVDVQLKDEKVQNLLRDKTQKFDLILVEACVRPALIFAHIYKAPVIQISSFGAVFDNYPNMGAPIHPLLYPSMFSQRVNNLTSWEKLKELHNYYMIEISQQNAKKPEYEMLKKHFGNDIPTINELNEKVDMLFLNVHPIFEGIRPVPPSVVYMGGLHQKPEKELPTDLKSYLDFSKNGVIYISFGTNVDPTLLPPESIQMLVRVFSELPYDVLFKWNSDELPGRTNNIKISKWLPQSDLLKHPKIKLFITQAGLQSTDEAITAGVPLIGIPMLGDQKYNAEKYEYHNIGIRIDIETMTEEKLTKAINTILRNESYRQNIIRLRDLINDQPMKPLDRAVWWVEYVLRHGGAKHLRSPAANISWTEYLELELVAIVLSALLAGMVVFSLVFWWLCKFVVGLIRSEKIKRH